jgi:putative heme-binding domain-containing protein
MRGWSGVAGPVIGLILAIGTPAVSAAQAPVQDHSGQYDSTTLATGQKIYASICAVCHGPTGNGVANIDLRRGPLPRASTDDALRATITKGIPGTGMPSFRLEAAELSSLVAFIRSGFEETAAPFNGPGGGNAGAGRVIFETKGACLSCHRLFDTGMFSGPDLSEIGRLRQPAAIERSLVDPTGAMQPINRPVRAVLRDGSVVTGRRLNEDLVTVQIVTNDGRLVSLVKPELREWTVSTSSTMPSYKDSLTPSERADLVAFLVSLKGTKP